VRLTCDSVQLARALGAVARAIPARTALPVLGMVLLETTADGLLLSATNLELSIRRRIGASVAAEGAIAVPGRLLADYAGALPPEPLDLDLDRPQQRLRLRSSSFKAEIYGVAADEFPPAPTVDGGACLELRAHRLVEAISDTLAAASTDEARPVLTGIRLEVSGGRLRLVATDGYRLAVREVGVGEDHEADAWAVTVPARTMSEVVRILRGAGDADVAMTISPAGNHVVFRAPDAEIASRVIDGTFPDAGRLVPGKHLTGVTVAATELSHRVQALTPFAHGSANVVRLEATTGSIALAAAANDVGSARTDLDAEVIGPDLAVAFNARFLLDCPALASDGRVELRLHGSMGPIVVVRTIEDGFLYLFMPVRTYPLGSTTLAS